MESGRQRAADYLRLHADAALGLKRCATGVNADGPGCLLAGLLLRQARGAHDVPYGVSCENFSALPR